MPVRWFAVKTVYRSTAIGKPRVTDGDYDPDGTLVEERVVLLRARDHEDAIRKSEKDATQYAKETHTNPYGQSVVTRCLKAIESFELFDDPAEGTEAWSSTRVVPKSIPDSQIVDAVFGGLETKAQLKRRKKYLNREFSGEVTTPNTALQTDSRRAMGRTTNAYPMPSRKIDFDVVRKIALALPDVEESTIHGAPSLKVRGRLLTCPAIHRSAEPGTLAVRVDFDQRAELMAAEPSVYYVTDHYVNYPTVLVRLSQIDRDSLRDLLGMAWRFVSSNTKASRRKVPNKRRATAG